MPGLGLEGALPCFDPQNTDNTERKSMSRPRIRAIPAIKISVMVVDDQSTGRAILEEVVRSIDMNIAVQPF